MHRYSGNSGVTTTETITDDFLQMWVSFTNSAVQLHGLYRFAQTTKMQSRGLSSVSREAKRIQTQICFLLVWYTPVDFSLLSSYIQWTCDTGGQDCGCFLWSGGCFNPHQAFWLRHGDSSALFIFFWCGSQFSDVLMMFLCMHSMLGDWMNISAIVDHFYNGDLFIYLFAQE